MVENRKAYFNYDFVEEYECGLSLQGWEVKAIVNHECSIIGAHCKIFNGEAFLIGASIGKSNKENDSTRTRKLLLHKKELNRLIGRIHEKGLTLIPLKLYNRHGKFKLFIGLGKGKKEYDKRDADKKRDTELDNRRIVKSQKLS